MRRTVTLAVVAWLVVAACGGGEEAGSTITTTTSTSTTIAATSSAAPETTVANTTTSQAAETTSSTTTATTSTSTTTTAAPSQCPIPLALPEGTLRMEGGSGDFDGDGATDELFTYQAGPDDWRVRVVFSDGGGADAAVGDAMDFAPPRPMGGFDIDGDGVQEAFLTVGAGASTIQIGMFDIGACVATRVTANGVPAAFSVGASVGAGSGMECLGDGVVRRNFAQRVDESTFEGGYEEYLLDGSHLVSQGTTTGTLTSEDAATLAGFNCGGLSLP